MSVRSDIPPAAVPALRISAAVPERRSTILPPGERERRRGADRRRADRRTQDLGPPYGADRRSGHDDRQADRRENTTRRPAGIGLMRDYFSQADAAAPASSPSAEHVDD